MLTKIDSAWGEELNLHRTTDILQIKRAGLDNEVAFATRQRRAPGDAYTEDQIVIAVA